MANYQFRKLTLQDMKQMHMSFLEAFEDYAVSMKPGYADFKSRMLFRLNIDFNYSIGVFSGDKLVAFLLNTFNHFEDIPTIYNGGTGVIPGHRGGNLTFSMYEYLRSAGLPSRSRFILETLTSNTAAICVYKKIGFERRRLLLCFRQESKPIVRKITGYSVKTGTFEDVAALRTFDSVEGSFSDSLQQLRYNKDQEKVLLCHDGNEVVGYLVMQPGLGRISRLAVAPSQRRKQVGSFLLNQAFIYNNNKPMYVLNVPEEARDIQQFLINRGFENQLNQWEMELFV